MKKFAKNIIGLLFGILILGGITGVQNVSASADCTEALEPYWYRNTSDNKEFGADNTMETFSMWGKPYYHGYFKNYYSDDAAVAFYLDNSLYQTVELFVPMMNQEFEIPTEGITQLRLEFEKKQFADYGIGDIKGVGPAHTFQSEILSKPQVGKDGVRLDTCTRCMASRKVILPALAEKPLKKGDTFKSGRFTYKVTGVSGKSGTAQVTKATSTTAAITVPATVTKNGVTLQIKTISAKAFYKNKTKKVTIGRNVSTIGTQAFAGCQNLKNITIQSTGIKKMGSSCFKGIHKKAVIKVPASRLNTYKKLFKSQGQAKTVVIRK